MTSNVTAPSTSIAATLFPAEQYSLCAPNDGPELQLVGHDERSSTP